MPSPSAVFPAEFVAYHVREDIDPGAGRVHATERSAVHPRADLGVNDYVFRAVASGEVSEAEFLEWIAAQCG